MCAAHEFPQLVLSANGGLMLCREGLLRSLRVMLDYDLAELYGVETRALKQAVRRNLDRFPADFMFELVGEEVANMVSQNVILGRGKLGGARPMAFTEQGVAMLSSKRRSHPLPHQKAGKGIVRKTLE